MSDEGTVALQDLPPRASEQVVALPPTQNGKLNAEVEQPHLIASVTPPEKTVRDAWDALDAMIGTVEAPEDWRH